LSGGQNEPEAITSTSREEGERGWHWRDSTLSYVSKSAFEAVPKPPNSDSQHHFSAPDAVLRHADLEDDYDPLNLDSNTSSPSSPPSLDAPSTSSSPIDYVLDLDSAYDEEKDDDITPVARIVSTVAAHDHESDHSVNLLFDLEFEDYSDALKLSQEVIPPPYPARGSPEKRMDTVDDKVAYIMGITIGE
jgi:hypothetical protein